MVEARGYSRGQRRIYRNVGNRDQYVYNSPFRNANNDLYNVPRTNGYNQNIRNYNHRSRFQNNHWRPNNYDPQIQQSNQNNYSDINRSHYSYRDDFRPFHQSYQNQNSQGRRGLQNNKYKY